MTEKYYLAHDILAYYERNNESERLGSGAGLLEFARTKELVRRFLMPPPIRVLYPVVSKRSIPAMPLRPEQMPSQDESTSLPSGESIPMPVITTRRLAIPLHLSSLLIMDWNSCQ